VLDNLSLKDEIEQPDLKPWERRIMLGVLERLKMGGYLTHGEAAEVDVVRECVLRTLDKDAPRR